MFRYLGRMILLLAALVATLGACASDNRGTLTGRVQNLFGEPVAATVSVKGLDVRVEANADGRYALPFVPGRFTVRYEASNHFPVERQFDIYKPARATSSPVDLVPVPPAPGLWKVDHHHYSNVAPTSVRLEEERALGLLSGSRRLHVVDGSPVPWCRSEPLVAQWKQPVSAPPFSAWAVHEGGVLWPDGLEQDPSAARSIDQQPVAENVWTIRTQSTGALFLTLSSQNRLLPVRSGYYLEVKTCTEADP